MLNDASQIIGDVPGKHLDPLLLVRSQANDSLGFIMISYEQKPAISDQPKERYCDLLFFRGPEIYECARMNRDLRFQLHTDVAFHTFELFGREDATRVYLFVASDEVLHRFRSTFYYEPCLKVQIEGLSKKHIATLLRSTGCQRGIIECNEFVHPTPSLDLKEITSSDDIIHYQPSFKRGRILVYDTEKNKELIEERYASQSTRLAQSTTRVHNAADDKSTIAGQTLIQSVNTSKGCLNDEALSPVDEQEAEEFTSFIKQILNSSPSADNHAHAIHDDSSQTGPFVITHRVPDQPPSAAQASVDSPPLQRRDTSLQRPVTGLQRRVTRLQRRLKSQTKKLAAGQATEDTSDSKQEQPQEEPSDYVRLLERLFRSFRQQVFDSFGDKCDAVIADAESKVRFLTPEFDFHSLNESTAIIVLDLIEHIAAEASFLKRPRLRQAALALVADLYNKQYELLEKYRVIDKVEQFYYRLKK